MSARVLVAGVGNVFLADDGFGVEVLRRLQGTSWPEGVHVEDFGIRGVHLAYQLLEGYDALILVDALPRGEAPGTVSVLEVSGADLPEPAGPADGHALDPRSVLALLRRLGGSVGRVLVVGCEPAELEERMGLSEPVQGAVDQAAHVVRRLVEEARGALAGGEGGGAARGRMR